MANSCILPASTCCISPFASLTRRTLGRYSVVIHDREKHRFQRGYRSRKCTVLMQCLRNDILIIPNKEYFIHKTRRDCNNTDLIFLKQLFASDPSVTSSVLAITVFTAQSLLPDAYHKSTEQEESLGRWPWFIGTYFLGLLRTIQGISRYRT